MKGGPFGEICFPKKSLTTPKKIERTDPLGFFYTQSVAKPKKMEGGPFGEKFFSEKKSLALNKKFLCFQSRWETKGFPFGFFRHYSTFFYQILFLKKKFSKANF